MDSCSLQARIKRWLYAAPLRQQVWALLCRESRPIYLVGGSVRDALLGRPSCDLDLAVDGAALKLARYLANALGGAYVPLDAERDVGRVVIQTPEGEQHIDLAGLRGPSGEGAPASSDILADLRARDLTINAMAVRVLSEPGELLDPTGGLADLEDRLLRAASPSAFADDPLRVLRVARLEGALGFRPAPETIALARQEAQQLANASPERLRDELFNMLGLAQAGGALRRAHDLGALAQVVPEALRGAGAPQRGLGVLAFIEALWVEGADPDSGLVHVGDAAALLAPYLANLRGRWGEQLTHGRRRWEALKLAALLADEPAPEIAALVAGRLRLSNHEERFLALSLRASRRVTSWSHQGMLRPTQIYRFYREAGDAGLDGCILALARWAQGAEEGTQGRPAWEALSAQVGALLEAWHEQHTVLVDPPRLVSGADLVRALDAKPGPRIGRLIEAIREAQVEGQVHTQAQALAHARYLDASWSPGEMPAQADEE